MRKPGSQVAPNQKPLHTSARTATTHHKVPPDQAHAGKTFRVRDKHEPGKPGRVWGQDMTWTDANQCKEQVVGSRKSKTARVERMDVPMPGDPDLAQSEAAPEAAPAATGARRRQEAYRDKTVVKPKPRLVPPPKDPTIGMGSPGGTMAAAAQAASRSSYDLDDDGGADIDLHDLTGDLGEIPMTGDGDIDQTPGA